MRIDAENEKIARHYSEMIRSLINALLMGAHRYVDQTAAEHFADVSKRAVVMIESLGAQSQLVQDRTRELVAGYVLFMNAIGGKPIPQTHELVAEYGWPIPK